METYAGTPYERVSEAEEPVNLAERPITQTYVTRDHVMIDLETMGTKPTAAILTVGAVIFDPVKQLIGDRFYRRVQWDTNVGRDFDPDTIKWWMAQDEEARREILDEGTEPLNFVLRQLERWICDLAYDPLVWSNGSNFDIAILDNAYGYHHSGWGFRSIRDMRTVMDLAGLDSNCVPFAGTPHHALDDAIHQARCVLEAYKVLGANQ